MQLNRRMLLEDILRAAHNDTTSYIVDVYLKSPRERHGKFKKYPPSPESNTLDAYGFSEFQRDLAEQQWLVRHDKFKGRRN